VTPNVQVQRQLHQLHTIRDLHRLASESTCAQLAFF
jgi:hypothetical protein